MRLNWKLARCKTKTMSWKRRKNSLKLWGATKSDVFNLKTESFHVVLTLSQIVITTLQLMGHTVNLATRAFYSLGTQDSSLPDTKSKWKTQPFSWGLFTYRELVPVKSDHNEVFRLSSINRWLTQKYVAINSLISTIKQIMFIIS